MDLWLNADEAARLISAHHFAGGLSEFIRLARGVGIGVDLSGQVADVSPAVLSNTANRFIGRVTSSLDLEVIGSSMGLTAEQRRYVFHTLTPGQFIAQIGTGEWRRPFVLRIPKLNLSGAAPSECDERPDVALPALPSEPVRT